MPFDWLSGIGAGLAFGELELPGREIQDAARLLEFALRGLGGLLGSLRLLVQLTASHSILFAPGGFGRGFLLRLFLGETRRRRQLATDDFRIRFRPRGSRLELTASRFDFLSAFRAFLKFAAGRVGFFLSALRRIGDLATKRLGLVVRQASVLLQLAPRGVGRRLGVARRLF